MTQDEIIRMAREAGFFYNIDAACTVQGNSAQLERFAALVAAAEREACAMVAEVERAAFIEASAHNNGRQSDFAFGSVNSSERIAASIRARGEA